MLLNLKVIPHAKKIIIKRQGGNLKVYLTAPAIEGKANNLLIEVLSGHFKVNKSSISIIRGEKSRHKLVKINGL